MTVGATPTSVSSRSSASQGSLLLGTPTISPTPAPTELALISYDNEVLSSKRKHPGMPFFGFDVPISGTAVLDSDYSPSLSQSKKRVRKAMSAKEQVFQEALRRGEVAFIRNTASHAVALIGGRINLVKVLTLKKS
jgi:hypothetical protein